MPAFLKRWELWVLVILVSGLTALAVAGKGRHIREAYQRFLRNAPRVQAALERFAADHQGRFPPDAMHVRRPQGLGESYIQWDPSWKIDYEVHPNGAGRHFVCLEFCGPEKELEYFGLCRKPELRRKYGRGQAIPGNRNRIWLIRESADIMPRQGG